MCSCCDDGSDGTFDVCDAAFEHTEVDGIADHVDAGVHDDHDHRVADEDDGVDDAW